MSDDSPGAGNTRVDGFPVVGGFHCACSRRDGDDSREPIEIITRPGPQVKALGGDLRCPPLGASRLRQGRALVPHGRDADPEALTNSSQDPQLSGAVDAFTEDMGISAPPGDLRHSAPGRT
ncbi:hypothetical protein GCM10017674_53270 [Streptomyces gardneri]|uniref:Uncharacterized protein n=1 Tax=Streptomyces gardneri TaxID=66892 RepID=A0A4Y3RCX0_9ACTN|nr:hypothetical protein SGA01_09290 [Streptomyces gardneri]GHH09660.1 hypothetical protein GCM10017674_53270 [Streptomyces gardneri]